VAGLKNWLAIDPVGSGGDRGHEPAVSLRSLAKFQGSDFFRYADGNNSAFGSNSATTSIFRGFYMNMPRRSFLTYFGVGWAASCFPLVLSACDTGAKKNEADPKVAANPTNPETKPAAPGTGNEIAAAGGFTVIGTVAELDKSGSVGDKKVVVVRDPANKAKVLAVNPTCTHKGCVVKWKSAEGHFECPCHDADFAADGKVLKSPATKPLATYTAKIEGDKVLVKLA
jgi:cytochrome b6-f complex iron-sulfur subunit